MQALPALAAVFLPQKAFVVFSHRAVERAVKLSLALEVAIRESVPLAGGEGFDLLVVVAHGVLERLQGSGASGVAGGEVLQELRDGEELAETFWLCAVGAEVQQRVVGGVSDGEVVVLGELAGGVEELERGGFKLLLRHVVDLEGFLERIELGDVGGDGLDGIVADGEEAGGVGGVGGAAEVRGETDSSVS